MSVDALPPLYARWIEELVGAPLPPESEATCGTCRMLPSASAPPGATFFDPETKCCTYLPVLHNFLAGRVLREPVGTPGRETVLARIERGVEVTPLGLRRPRSFLVAYQEGGGATFGRSRELRCPHLLEDGACGIWASRESTCATWFCKYVRGQTGHELWRIVHRLLATVEHRLAAVCATGRPWEVARAADFYRACAAQVDALSWTDVLAIGGPEAAALAVELQAAVAASHDPAPPARLVKGALRIVAAGTDWSAVVTYNDYDPVELPNELLGLLDRFDGRTTREVLADLEEHDGVELDAELVRRLVDFGVLVPA